MLAVYLYPTYLGFMKGLMNLTENHDRLAQALLRTEKDDEVLKIELGMMRDIWRTIRDYMQDSDRYGRVRQKLQAKKRESGLE